MTTIPAVGTTWKAGGYAEVDNRFYSRGPLAAVLIRDNRGAATNISPYKPDDPSPSLNWSPFASDGELRDDMFAMVRDPATGQWYTNPDTNEGFWITGALDEKGGPDRKADIKHDDAMILQSNFPFDTDLTGEGMTIQFTGVEVLKPLMLRLRMNLPLSDTEGNSMVENPGAPLIVSKPVDADSIDRQILLMFGRKKPSGFIWTCEAYPLVKLTDIGNFKRDKTDADAPSLSYTALPDPYHVNLDPTDPSSGQLVPAFYSIWVAGQGWTAIASDTLVFPPPAPVAVPVAGGLAVVSFTELVGGIEPYAYTVTKYAGGHGGTASSATVADTQVNGDEVSLVISGLTGATHYVFVVHGTDATTPTALTGDSLESNEITAIT